MTQQIIDSQKMFVSEGDNVLEELYDAAPGPPYKPDVFHCAA